MVLKLLLLQSVYFLHQVLAAFLSLSITMKKTESPHVSKLVSTVVSPESQGFADMQLHGCPLASAMQTKHLIVTV